MNYHGKIEETDILIGNMGLGVDYYKGEKGIPGKDGKDGSDQVYVGADEPTDERVKLWIDTDATPSSGGAADSIDWSKVQNKPNFADVATSGDYNDLSNKPPIPSVEGLASETYVNEKVAAIVIPEVPTKVSELENDKGYLTEHQSLAEYAKKTEIPAPYTLPTASTSTLGGVKVDGNTITIADGVISAKSGGSSGGSGDIIRKTLSSTDRNDIPDWIPDWCANPSKYAVWIDDKNLVFATYKINSSAINTYTFKIYWIENNQGCYSGNFYFTDSSFTTIKERSYFSMDSVLLTTSSYQTYISSWVIAQSEYDSNLYNAKELVVYVENTQGNKQMGYFNFGDSNLGNHSSENFYFGYDPSSPYIYYTGSSLSYGNVNNLFYICYKT